ncbi:MAG: hypothetical protein GY742_19400 [Hyphomicrobiales bacterium]|nr:hypothetical protein [Hyphomicrobiales bacterium]
MRDKFNELYKTMLEFEPYDWFLVAVGVIILTNIPRLLYYINTFVNKHFFGLERCKYIKGWKKIEK